MPLEKKYATLFLILFLGMFLISNVATFSIMSASHKIVLKAEMDLDTETEDSKKDVEDTDKIILKFRVHLQELKEQKRYFRYALQSGKEDTEVILPPPEMFSFT